MRSNKIIAHLSNNKDISQNDNVTVTDIDEVIKLINKGNALIKFYSSMCHHCTTMGPAWTELINMPQESTKTQYTIISIESEFLGNPKISALITKLKINVSGFPTIVFVDHNKNSINYEGPRTANNMNNFVINHLRMSNKKQTGGNRKKYGSTRHNNIRTRRTRRTRHTRHTRHNNKTRRGGCGCGL